MPTISEKYKTGEGGGDFLKAEDLKGRAVKVTITEIRWVEMPAYKNPEVRVEKVVCNLKGTDKVYVVNVPSAHTIAAAYGDDPETWVGRKIILKPHLYNGKFLGIAGEPDIAISDGFDQQPQQPQQPQRADNIGAAIAQEFGIDEDPYADVPF